MIDAIFGSGFWAAKPHEREMKVWNSLGSVKYRFRSVVVALILAALAVFVVLLTATLANLYPGTGTVFQGRGERLVKAEVGDCDEVGPISFYGFGYWWDCSAIIRDGDGGERAARIGRSVLSPSDRGEVVDVWEGCHEEGSTADCEYGSRPSMWMEAVVLVLGKLGWVAAFAIGCGVLAFLLRAFLGAPRSIALATRF